MEAALCRHRQWRDKLAATPVEGPSTPPVADGLLEAGSQVDLDALRADMEGWFTRKFGQGQSVKLSLTSDS